MSLFFFPFPFPILARQKFSSPPCWKKKPAVGKFFVFFCCRGLCAVYRSKAGDLEGEENTPPHNSHWLSADNAADATASDISASALGGPSRYVGYYDATSLYPSSSKYACARARTLGFKKNGSSGGSSPLPKRGF